MSNPPIEPGPPATEGGWGPPSQVPPSQVPPNQGPPEWGQPAAPSSDATTFFRALFDLSFTRFITPMIIKFVYVLMMVVIAIVYLFYAILLFRADTSIGVLWLLVVGPVASVLWLAIARMTLEFYLAVVRVSEDVHTAVGRGGR